MPAPQFNSFSIAVLKALLRPEHEAELRAKARQHRREYPDADQAAIALATSVSDALQAKFEGDELWNDMMILAFRRVNFRRVAEYILDRYCPLPEKQFAFWTSVRCPSLN